MNTSSRRGRRLTKKKKWSALFEVEYTLVNNSDALFLMSLLQDSGSDFASVVHIPERLAPWPKVGHDESLAQLHAKFWGMSMAVEEQQWHSTIIGGELGDEHQDGDERMDEDENNGTDLGDDITPGCYVLDFGIEGLEFSKIWIRADYIRIYNYLEIRHRTPGFPQGRAPAAVITGQPGIGEFLSIALSEYYSHTQRKKCLHLLCFTPTPC
jgi:hypothetical protein